MEKAKENRKKTADFKRSRGREDRKKLLAAKQTKCSDADLRPDSHPRRQATRPGTSDVQTTDGEQ